MGSRTVAAYIAGFLTAVAFAAFAAFNYFPPPGITYALSGTGGNMVLLAPTGGGIPLTINPAGTPNDALQINANTGGQGSIALEGNAAIDARIGVAGATGLVCNSSVNGDLCINSTSNGVIRLQTTNVSGIQLTNSIGSEPVPVVGDTAAGSTRILRARYNITSATACSQTDASPGWGSASALGSVCTVVFAHTFTAVPACVVSNENGTSNVFANVASGVATSQVSFLLVNTAGTLVTGLVDIICIGT